MIRFATSTTAVPTSLPGRVLLGLVRLLLLGLGALLTLALLVAGLLMALGLVLWAVLRGRRPTLAPAFGWARRQQAFRPRQATTPDVVDIEAHEVPVHRADGGSPAPRRLPG